MLLALLVSPCAARAEAPATSVQLSDEQVNQIVKAVTGAVLNDLKASPQTRKSRPRS